MTLPKSTTVLAAVLLALAVLVLGTHLVGAEAKTEPGHCPLCGTRGEMIPSKEDLAHCECEKWWYGKHVSRIAVGDCSDRYCPGVNDPKLVFVDLPLYRCPKDGLLFTEPK